VSGLVDEREYLRVVRERNDLAERVAWHESEAAEDRAAARVAALHARLNVPPSWGRMLLALAHCRTVRWERLEEAGGFTHGSAKVQAHRLRDRLRAAGAPETTIIAVRGIGYRLTEEARDWLRQHVPDAFPASKEPSR
jgi:hypothetical protein